MAAVRSFSKVIALVSAFFFVSACGNHGSHHGMKASDVVVGDLTLSGTWVRAASPPAKTSAVYFTVTNSGAATDRLLSVITDIAEFSEVHQSLTEDGVALMRKVRELEIPAGESVALEPGSYHIMLINLTGNIEAGDSVPLTLTFAEAGEVVVNAIARDSSAAGHDHH